MFHSSPIRTLMFVLAGLVAILIVMSALMLWSYSSRNAASSAAELPVLKYDVPKPTATDYVTKQNGFQYLVSYTDKGFLPTLLTVHKGETVRFTNNTTAAAQFTVGSQTSASLLHGQYWEYTFKTTGVVRYADVTGTHTGTITVQ